MDPERQVTSHAQAVSLDTVIARVQSLLGPGKFGTGWTVICREERIRIDTRGDVVVVEITGHDPGPVRFLEVRSPAQLDLLTDYLQHKCKPGQD